MTMVTCYICDRKIEGKYYQANIDKELKSTEQGVTVCSMECAKEYEETLPFQGRPIDRWSRITGYYQNIDAWNAGKKQELKDRRRYGTR